MLTRLCRVTNASIKCKPAYRYLTTTTTGDSNNTYIPIMFESNITYKYEKKYPNTANNLENKSEIKNKNINNLHISDMQKNTKSTTDMEYHIQSTKLILENELKYIEKAIYNHCNSMLFTSNDSVRIACIPFYERCNDVWSEVYSEHFEKMNIFHRFRTIDIERINALKPSKASISNDNVISIANLLQTDGMNTTDSKISSIDTKQSLIDALLSEYNELCVALNGKYKPKSVINNDEMDKDITIAPYQTPSTISLPVFDVESHSEEVSAWKSLIQSMNGLSEIEKQALLKKNEKLTEFIGTIQGVCDAINCNQWNDYSKNIRFGLDLSTELICEIQNSIQLGEMNSECAVDSIYTTVDYIQTTCNAHSMIVLCSFNPLTHALMSPIVDRLKGHVSYMFCETLRAHPTKPGLLVNSDMAGQHKSIYGGTGHGNDMFGQPKLETEKIAIEKIIQECVEELQQSMRACIKMEKVYIEKFHSKAIEYNKEKNVPLEYPPITSVCYGHLIAAKQHTIHYPEEWCAIQEISLQTQLQAAVASLRTISNGHKSLKDWLVLYLPMVRFMFMNYERFLHARKRSILHEMYSSITGNNAALSKQHYKDNIAQLFLHLLLMRYQNMQQETPPECMTMSDVEASQDIYKFDGLKVHDVTSAGMTNAELAISYQICKEALMDFNKTEQNK